MSEKDGIENSGYRRIQSSNSLPPVDKITAAKKILETPAPKDILGMKDFFSMLDKNINGLASMNDKQLSDLNNLMLKFQEKVNEPNISSESKELVEKLNFEISYLQTLIKKYQELFTIINKELPEVVINDAIKSINEILGSKPNAILIGVNKYSQADIGNLEGSINDTRAVSGKLTNDYKLPSDKIKYLTDEKATKLAILDSIKNSPDGPLFIYFAGHGINGHLVPYLDEKIPSGNNSKEVEKLSISPNELFTAIGNRKAILIVDKCYAGKLTKNVPKNITIITSSDENNTAEEISGSNRRISATSQARQEINIPNSSNQKAEKRGLFTYGLTSGNDGFNLPRGINRAKHQNPNISQDGTNVGTQYL